MKFSIVAPTNLSARNRVNTMTTLTIAIANKLIHSMVLYGVVSLAGNKSHCFPPKNGTIKLINSIPNPLYKTDSSVKFVLEFSYKKIVIILNTDKHNIEVIADISPI